MLSRLSWTKYVDTSLKRDGISATFATMPRSLFVWMKWWRGTQEMQRQRKNCLNHNCFDESCTLLTAPKAYFRYNFNNIKNRPLLFQISLNSIYLITLVSWQNLMVIFKYITTRNIVNNDSALVFPLVKSKRDEDDQCPTRKYSILQLLAPIKDRGFS